MLRTVSVLVYDGVAPFELGVLCEAWGLDRADDGVPAFEFTVCAPEAGRVRTSQGFDLLIEHGLDRVADADLVALPAMPRADPVPDPVLEAVSAAAQRGARLLSVCSGAFVLGAAGLLDGRRCTTHWRYAEELATRFPAAQVDPDVLYVDEDPIITSAGSAAGLDACLHLLRKEFGAHVAGAVARRMVVPPHRDGGQAQFVRRQVPDVEADTVAPVLDWMVDHLEADLSVAELARRAHMSPRTFARRFRAETGTTPHQWLSHQRVLLAERLLEETGMSIEEVAQRSGFGTAASLRHSFTRARGTSPVAYRRTFGHAVAATSA
ncbi:MAG: Transcriptional regulator, AraC family [uncultured Nocardioidaceae bacterium]|uniref:Transcriptional regulator, AraC family n=1 Tax=uncultured Nocardioidaceae bacterium TaxID=253824 RepID=A0A6J4M852_9ACTN|nr:MAG: Transcriptional regulator, AraC family [uncultured Nocardioidaceae bacterium]